MELCLSATAQHRRPVLQRGLQLQLQWPTLQPQFLPKALGMKREEAGRSWFKLLVTGRAALPPGRFSTVSALSEQVTLCASTGTRFSSSWRNSSVRHLRKVRGTMMFSSLTNATVKQIVRRQSFFCLCNRGEGLEVWRSQAQVADAVVLGLRLDCVRPARSDNPASFSAFVMEALAFGKTTVAKSAQPNA